MKRILASQIITSSTHAAYKIVIDVANFPNFMSNIVSINIIEDSGDRKIVEWVMEIDGAEIEWTEEIIYSDVELTARFRAISGMFAIFDGIWRVAEHPRGALINVELEYGLGLPEIEDIIGDILGKKLNENVEAMLIAIERRAT